MKIRLRTLGWEWEVPDLGIPVARYLKGDENFMPTTLYLCAPCGFYDFEQHHDCPICNNTVWYIYCLADVE